MTSKAIMCMKTNKTEIFFLPKMWTFLFKLVKCSDILCKPTRILRESAGFLPRIEARRMRSSFQSKENQAPSFTGCGYVADSFPVPPHR
jgi:hypothetical protein